MVAIFREKSAVSVFWLIALSVILHGQFIVSAPQVVVSDTDVWMKALLMPLAGVPSVILILIYHAVIIIQALRLSVVLNNLRMFPKLYFVPALCYLLLTAVYPPWNNITPALFINFFILWLFSLFAGMYSSPQSKSLIYNIGFLAGLVGLIHSPALFLIPAAFFAIALLRAFHLNEWMILLLGIITPAYLLAALLFLNDNLSLFMLALPRFHWHLLPIKNSYPLLIAACAAGLLIVSGTASWQANIGRMIIQTRRCWSVLFLMLLLSIPLVFGISGENTESWLFGTIPAAALGSNLFVYSKNNLLQNILFWLLVVVIIFNNWFWLKT